MKNLLLQGFLVLMLLSALSYAVTSVTTEQMCKNTKGSSCKCYDFNLGWRQKTAHDKPVFIQHGNQGFVCYCNKQDYDDVLKNREGVIDLPQEQLIEQQEEKKG